MQCDSSGCVLRSACNFMALDGCHRRTGRKPRVVENNGPASKSEFEFTRLDLPELPGPENSERSEAPRQPRWGPAHVASPPREVGKPATVAPEVSGWSWCCCFLGHIPSQNALCDSGWVAFSSCTCIPCSAVGTVCTMTLVTGPYIYSEIIVHSAPLYLILNRPWWFRAKGGLVN